MKLPGLVSGIMLMQLAAAAQYAPQATLPGSTAISATGGQFVGWASGCALYRGLQNIADPSLGLTIIGDNLSATGPADREVVSLGDSGVAVLTFSHPIYNDAGADFAVFENGFPNPADPTQAFLELAFVEVSSDGINYFRFPASSNTQATTQVPGSGVYMDASLLNNLAGKYIASYGTPFDLQELAGTAGLDVNNVTHIRIVDVIGALSAHASRDAAGNTINDPYPTNFPSGGFDLDAVGAIHQYGTAVKHIASNISVRIFPNPATDNITVVVDHVLPTGLSAVITTTTGTVIQQSLITGSTTILPLAQYPAGIYYLLLSDSNGNKWAEKIVKY